jgi:hypothetical protein
MEAYRKIVDIKDKTLKLLLPDKFKNKKVEVIILPVKEQGETRKRKPSDFIGCITEESAVELLKEIENSRNEWEERI